ncbi:hypothetical protein [Winogradskyella sp. SYSU M77433]|uniref:DUF7935 family protein n=1 Tax=Winogradskyella sp. SYSU M77433 TaxID=3042722 RepID=UPI0024805727|nr:hypothetical protein [Winogradskyella sp. SYSU M77433]MDH7914366.1 hypothetical protein [Winogradskyella sp. SYSU M77433]
MDIDQITDVLINLLPAVLVAAIAIFFFKQFVDNEQRRRRFLIQKDLKKESLPVRLQAYERMTLFLERISPTKLITRVNPTSSNKEDYEALLIANIEQEFNHNLSQQIYVTDECWSVITASKNATIQLIRKANMQEKTDSADKLREVILTDLMDKQAPSNTGLSYIRQEVSQLL